MTKNDRIFKLFAKYFEADDFLKRGKAKAFHCPNERKCSVDKEKEPIHFPYIGYDNTHVMIVAEAPSIGRGTGGPYIVGRFDDIDERLLGKSSPIYAIKTFVKKNYNTVPYFTDLVKCGFANQSSSGKEKILKKRALNCHNKILLREIQIIQPKIILCLGKQSHTLLKEYKSDKNISSSIKLFYLMHYSRRASLPLSPEDKSNIVWEWQIGSSSERRQIMQEQLSKLSYFQKPSKPT